MTAPKTATFNTSTATKLKFDKDTEILFSPKKKQSGSHHTVITEN